jgi:alkylation response protein AidB-like acyl-CoA dehydrogenase
MGLDFISRMVMLEELGAGDLGFGFTMFIANIGIERFVKSFGREVIDEFIKRIVEDDTFLFAGATSEQEHGTDVHFLYDAPGVTVRTFAEKKGDEWVINGTKLWTTNGGAAKLYTVQARTRQDLGISQSMSTFLVPADTTGFSVRRIIDKMGSRMEMNGELVFENVHIPARYLVGEENKAWAAREKAIGVAAMYKTALCLGGLQTIYDETLSYAKTRVQGGKPIIEHPTVMVMLGDIRAKIEAVRLLNYQNAWRMDNQEYDPKMAWSSFGYMKSVAEPIAANALEIFGAVGQVRGTFIEKHLRDLRTQLQGLGLRAVAFIKGAPVL